jgi:hypothetical protein
VAEKGGALGSQVPAGDELTVVRGFLQLFGIPVISQMLVYSATSRQTVISPYRPRALYFNEEVYFGYVPGGRIEVASIDPLAGPVFYIFNFPKPGPVGFQPDPACHAAGIGPIPGCWIVVSLGTISCTARPRRAQ